MKNYTDKVCRYRFTPYGASINEAVPSGTPYGASPKKAVPLGTLYVGMIDNYLEFAIKIARQAGKLLVVLQPRLAKQSKTKSTTLDLVTKADYLSEKLIINRIKRKYHHHRILSEEEYSSKIQTNPIRICGGQFSESLLWVIDPLDGTTNYSHQFPFYCVSIALVKNDPLPLDPEGSRDENPEGRGKKQCSSPVRYKILLGVVYNPNLDELFYASIGKGAYLNNKRLKVSNTNTLSKSMLATGFPYIIREKLGDNFRNFQRFCLNAQAIRRAGAAALDLAYVACGRFDGFWERELKPWDTAAGVIILTEAGGKATDFKNNKYNPFSHHEILATNKYIHQQMINLLNKR